MKGETINRTRTVSLSCCKRVYFNSRWEFLLGWSSCVLVFEQMLTNTEWMIINFHIWKTVASPSGGVCSFFSVLLNFDQVQGRQ